MQAGERTSHLFRLANFHGGIVVGTGDLSELALGWCTYGVGDHMSHYNVNASVPKTLIKHLVRWVAETEQLGERGDDVLDEILETEISPELVPGKRTAEAQPAQETEGGIGPYELQDFNLYYIAALRLRADQGRVPGLDARGTTASAGAWPDGAARGAQRSTRWPTIKKHLRHLPVALLQDQPVQALLRAERAEGRLRRLAVAARRLARAERLGSRRCG